MKTRFCLSILTAVVLLTSCGDDVPETVAMPTLPVTVLELAEQSHVRERELTGVVNLYREEEIGFEIDGRVTAVLDEGLQVNGPIFDEQGRLLRRGDPIAAMEGRRYGSQVGALQARLDAARRDLQAVDAQVKLAQQTLERQKAILAEGAGAQQAVDDAQSAYDQARAQLAARRATVQEVTQQLDSASEDLGDAVLFAPFPGRITQVHISEGAVIQAGTPVVTLTLMDPVRIQVEVSADQERELKTGDRAVVYPKDPLLDGERTPINAIVFEKSAVADPALRTFRIDMLARNARRHIDQLDPSLKGLAIINDYLPAVHEYVGEDGPLFVPVESILNENGRHYVLRFPGVSFHSGASRGAVGKHVPEKVEVTLGDLYMTVVSWNFRAVRESDGLKEGDFLILNPQPEHLNGVAVGRPQWLFRPRDLVPVRFELSPAPTGFYVPNQAISLSGNKPAVFLVDDGVARVQPISLHETVGDLRRIEGQGIVAGARIVVGGVHYVSDGQPVSISDTL